MEITATNAKQLSKQVDRFNAAHDDAKIYVNWGREGRLGTWYAHAEYGTNLKTGLLFSEVVQYVQREANLALEFAQDSRSQ